MNKICHRNVLIYLQKRGLIPKDFYADMVDKLGDIAPALSTVENGQLNVEGEQKVLKITQGLNVLQLPLSTSSPHSDG